MWRPRSPISWSSPEISHSGRAPHSSSRRERFWTACLGRCSRSWGITTSHCSTFRDGSFPRPGGTSTTSPPISIPLSSSPASIAVGLDTMPAWRWKAGHVSPRQAGIVRDAFETAPADTWRILVTHHPVLPEKLSGLVGRRLLVNTCAEMGVAVLLSGHTHVPSVAIAPLGEPGRLSALAVVSGYDDQPKDPGEPEHLRSPQLGWADGGRSDSDSGTPTGRRNGLVGRPDGRFECTPNGVIAMGAPGLNPD